MERREDAGSIWTPETPGFSSSGSITVSMLLAQLPEDVRVRHDAGDRPLRWVEPSEIPDPTPYLMDHELLLTSGMPLIGADAVDAEVFVQRLVAANAAALGFGLEPHFSGIPEELVQACIKHGLTLWEIPSTIPFAALGLTFARLLETENAAVIRDIAEASRQLLRGIVGVRPEQDLLDTLGQLTGGHVELYGARGQLRFTGSSGPAIASGDLVEELVTRTLEGSGPRVERLATDEAVVVSFPLRSPPPARRTTQRHRPRHPETTLGALVVTLPEDLSVTHHSIVSTAVGLLEALARERSAGSLSLSQLATALLLGSSAAVSSLLPESVGGPRRAPLRIVVGSALPDAHPDEEPGYAVLQWRQMWETGLVVHHDGVLSAITRLHPTDSSLSAAVKAGYAVVVSGPAGDAPHLPSAPAGPSTFLRAHEEALALLPKALAERRGLRAEDSEPSILGFLAPHAGRRLAEGLLGPLAPLDAKRRIVLIRSLRAWLEANGSFDAASDAVGLHRNSLRRHISTLGDLLGVDLQDAGVRADLWVALHFVPVDEDPGGTVTERGRD